MFTGIIEAIGQIKVVDENPLGRSLIIATPFKDLVLGESVAINGACLTVESANDLDIPGHARFFLSAETLDKTNLARCLVGTKVNLERALLPTARLSGHLVQGHVDGQAQLLSVTPVGESRELKVQVPKPFLKYTVDKGSITLDGISLTINRIENDILSFMIIPHTWQHTSLHACSAGHALNFEVDVIAKYAERLCTPYLK